MTGRLLAPRGVLVAVLLVGSLFLTVGCGGGGSGGGDGDKQGRDTVSLVLGLQTPLGLQGTRGVGPEITIIYRLRDREFDRADVEIEYGIDRGNDLDGDGESDREWFPASEVPFDPNDPSTTSSGTKDLPGSPGVGTIHYFVWDGLKDLATGRYVTQDYVYTDDGRVLRDEFGEPVFQDFPGVRIRVRPISHGTPGPYTETDAFDYSSNNAPSTLIGDVEIPPEGEADGTVNEDVLLNWTAIDPDDDPVTIAVDWVQVPFGFDPSKATLETLEGLPWNAASTGMLGEGTKSLTASRTGIDHQWSWDSVKDAGTMNGYVMFRMRPIDEKLEVGTWTYMKTKFHLDNYTIFTDPDAQLPAISAGGRAVLLKDTSVLYVGGTGGAVASSMAAIFYPGLSQTTKGTVAQVNPGLNEARMMHTATRLTDGTVLIVGGLGTGGSSLATAEIYDPVTRTFSSVANSLSTARHNHTATLLRGGSVLIAGGEDGSGQLASAEIFDPETGEFSDTGTMVTARTGAEAVLLPGGRVLIAGGTGASGALQSVEIYDPFAEAFVATDVANDMAEARAGLSLTETTFDPIAVIAAGGQNGDPKDSIERFDWDTDAFATSAVVMQDARSHHVGVLLGDGKILFASGMNVGGLSATGDIYDVENDTMDTPNGDVVLPVYDAPVACLRNGRPVFFGGFDAAGDAVQQIQLFTPDGGFNYPPIAQITTPTAVEPWAFGVRFKWRAIDQEGDLVKINAQFRIKPSATDDSSLLSSEVLDRWLPATMKDKTVLGETSSGVTGLTSRDDFVTQLENPIDAPDVDEGEHLFVWFTENDIPKGNYDNVFFRILISGATPGETATSGRFSITKNAPVIARIQQPLNTFGHLVFPYYLQDSDSGNLARVVWEYGIDLNGDGKIVEADFETWASCTHSPIDVTIDTTTYSDSGKADLVTGSQDPDPNNDYTDEDGIPWGKKHHFIWDTVYDLGAPVTPRSDLIVRCTPYDYPAGDPDAENVGIDYQVHGFTLEMDPEGLTLESWAPQINNSAGTGYVYGDVKLDEPIDFFFSTPIEPTSVTRDSIQITRVGGTGQRVDGHFHVDNSSGKGKVTFYPQMQEIPARSDILEENAGYAINIPGYDPSNRTRPTVEQLGADPADTNERYVLETVTEANAFQTGTGVLPDYTAPNADALVKPTVFVNVATDTEIELSFTERIDWSSVTAEGFLVIAKVFSGVDSVVYGDLELRNVVDDSGPGGTVRQYAVLIFKPQIPLPADSATIEIQVKTGLTDLAGNSLASSATTQFTTATGILTVNGSFTEEFTNTTYRDYDETTAYWGSADPQNVGDGGAGLGKDGYLTGLHDIGDGTDGTLDFSSGDVTLDSDTEDTYNLTSLHVPAGKTLFLTGSKPITLKVIGDVLIEGTIDASGKPGEDVVFYDAYNEGSGDGSQGGEGGPGGGAGGSIGKYTWKQTSTVSGANGEVGYGAGSTSHGNAGVGTGYFYGTSSTKYDYYGSGGSGAGHVQAGEDGTFGYYSGTNYKSPPKGGSAYGYADLSGGLEAGSGGGSGSAIVLYYSPSSSYTYNGFGMASGGGGGGGGGALRVSAGGMISVTKFGKVLANGGDGGDTHSYAPYSGVFYRYYNSSYKYDDRWSYFSFYPGGGGGGSGGTVHMQAGSGFDLHGAVDVSGGEGGEGRYYKYYTNSTPYYDSQGGAGGDGRLVLDGPEAVSLSGAVNFQGIVTAGTAIAISGGSGSTDWTVSSSTSVNTDSGSGAPSGVTFTGGKFYAKNFTVNSGVTLTVSGSKPFIVYASGNVTVAGKIDAVGDNASNYTSTGAYGSNSGFRAYTVNYGAYGVAGGARGGNNAANTSYYYPPPKGTDGYGTNGSVSGTGAGKAGSSGDPLDRDYVYDYGSYSYWYYYEYFYFGGGGGGGGSAEPGKVGRSMATSWTSEEITGNHGAGGGTTVSIDSLTDANITGGGGGGGGCQGGYDYSYVRKNSAGTITYTYNPYYYGYGTGTGAGGGGGGVAIRTSGSMTLSGTIDVHGGKGGDRNPTSYTYIMYSGAGGGGGAGNVLLEAAKGFSLGSGATINARGGKGGRAYYEYSSTYYDYGTNVYCEAGAGGDGAIVLRAEKKPSFVNVGNANLGDKGTFYSSTFSLTRDGITKWLDSGAHAPDFSTLSITGDGIADLYIKGAHIDPMTGQPDLNSATDWIEASSLNSADGYRWFKVWVMLAGSTVSGKVPEIDSLKVEWSSRR